MFVNNVSQNEQEEISTYINDFVIKTKSDSSVNYTKLFISSIKNNISIAVLLWFAGLTVIGIFVVYAAVCIRGFTLGFSISSIIATLGMKNGMIFIFSSMLFQNIIFIPVLFAFAISGIRLYKSIMKDRRKENVKFEIIKHTIFSGIIGLGLISSSFIEVYISTNLFRVCLNFI